MFAKSRVKSGIILCLSLSVTAACTNARLSEISEQSVQQAKATGSFCSLPPGPSADVTKMIFVIDMSGSNIILGPNLTNAGVPTGTDYPGDRFTLIKKFLDSTCAGSNPNNQFSAFGFSASSGSYATFGAQCDRTDLGSVAQTKAQLDGLIATQNQAEQDPINQQIMTQTYYLKAFSCLNSIISDDIDNLPTDQKKNTSYMVYFLTDGLPTDFQTPTFPYIDIQTEKDNLKPVLDGIMQKAGAVAGGARIAPVLYGESKLPSAVPYELDILNFIAAEGGSITTDVNNVTDVDFCKLLNAQTQTQYTVRKFGVANLTALMRKGVLLADSDMDGIPDVDEVALGFDPTQPRSGVNGNLLLDGLCPKGLPASQCPVQTTCTGPNSVGLSSCDIAAYGLSDGLDSDKDLMPDILEIVKGTQPNVDDRMNNIDGDSLSLFQEIAVGRDPYFSDDGISPHLLIAYNQELSPVPLGDCASNQESWTFDITNMPLVSTLATSPSDSLSSQMGYYTHAANENVIFIYYIVGKLNDDVNNPLPAKLYGQFVKVSTENPQINLGKFNLLGDINGTFSPLH